MAVSWALKNLSDWNNKEPPASEVSCQQSCKHFNDDFDRMRSFYFRLTGCACCFCCCAKCCGAGILGYYLALREWHSEQKTTDDQDDESDDAGNGHCDPDRYL